MRTRGPTKLQKLIVFLAMLVVVVGGGIALVVYGKSFGLDIDILSDPRTQAARGVDSPNVAVTPSVPPFAEPSPSIPTNAPESAPESASPSVTAPPLSAPVSSPTPPRRAPRR